MSLASRCLAIILCLMTLTATAQTTSQATATPERLAELAHSQQWQRLLHYTPSWLPGRLRSDVDDPAFFLARAGAEDPLAELEATLEALQQDDSIRCRFPARSAWLDAMLPGVLSPKAAANCPDYDEWRHTIDASEAVLVLAASYLNSPSSMYGHTFLRFDSNNPERRSALLSFALNFGATIPPDENGFVYAWRGLFGGYPGQFAAGPYFEKLREYSRLESRDLWEYRLNLDTEEIDRLLAHVWELRDVRFDYYFFDENCSLRLLELLDIARPGYELAAQFRHYAIPIDTVRAVIASGMVSRTDYRPAVRTELRHQIALLDPAERGLARQLADDASVARSAEFSGLTADRQRLVADTAYRFFRDRTVHAATTDDLSEQNFLLLQQLRRTAGATPPPAPSRPPAPDRGHRTGLWALGAGSEGRKAFADLEWRLSYHDLLDPEDGYPAGASLNMGRLVLRSREGNGLRLQRLDLLEITSLAVRDEFFRPWSWRVNTGLERQWSDDRDVLVPQLNGGFGWTRAPTERLQLFLFATGRLEFNHRVERELDLAPGAAAGLRLRWPAGISVASMDHWHFSKGRKHTLMTLRHNLPLGTNLGLRLSLERSISESTRINEAGISLRYHFGS